VSKPTLVLLIVALALRIVFAGYAESKTVLERRPALAIAATPIAGSALLHPGTSGVNSSGDRFGFLDARFKQPSQPNPQSNIPAIPDILITALLCDGVQQPCWMELTQYQRQIHGFARTRYGVKLATSGGCKLAQQGGQPRLATPESLSGSLSSLSPPCFILRL
jgi:hypothetical protein